MKVPEELTLIDERETKAVIKQYKSTKTAFISNVTVLIIILIVAIALISNLVEEANIKITLICLLAIFPPLVLIIIDYYLFSDYYKYLALAKMNDKIRHEEKVRFAERQVLENSKKINKKEK